MDATSLFASLQFASRHSFSSCTDEAYEKLPNSINSVMGVLNPNNQYTIY